MFLNDNRLSIDRPIVPAPTKFSPGKSYATRSICDSDCWFSVTVISRTEKSVKVQRKGYAAPQLCRISIYEGVEQIKPWGSYSMCPVIGADDEGKGSKK